jgi:hypothetical protein
MSLEATLKSYFPVSYSGNTIMVDARTCEVGATLLPLNIGSYSDVCNRSSKNAQLHYCNSL